MNNQLIEECHKRSHEGQTTFPVIVGRLLEAGVERYTVDTLLGETTYYSVQGEIHRIVFAAARGQIGEHFQVDEVRASIRAAQRDEIRFPEFLRRILAAGCVSYTAFLHGKRVTYTGRLGDSHTELFPQK